MPDISIQHLLLSAGQDSNAVARFNQLYEEWKNKQNFVPNWSEFETPQNWFFETYQDTQSFYGLGASALAKIACLKLNGGLGTTMGCNGPKSLVRIGEKETFLDFICRQLLEIQSAHGIQVPLCLLNSQHTDRQTREALNAYPDQRLDIELLMQRSFPRLDSATGQPFHSQVSETLNWYPPGHGDVFDVLYFSGTLSRLLDRGIRYLFLSNSDNLGATLDCAILGYMIHHQLPFLMEVTPKTKADIKGGILVFNQNSGFHELLEMIQVAPAAYPIFQDVDRFPYFNTNTIWVDLQAVKEALDTGNFELSPLFNYKEIEGKKIVQIETAMGSAIQNFSNARAVIVGRERFFPVKHTQDLLLLRSDYVVKEGACLRFNPDRNPHLGVPNVTLEAPFLSVAELDRRIPYPISMKQLRTLRLSGDVRIGRNVSLKGDVVIAPQKGHSLQIPDEAVIENQALQD